MAVGRTGGLRSTIVDGLRGQRSLKDDTQITASVLARFWRSCGMSMQVKAGGAEVQRSE